MREMNRYKDGRHNRCVVKEQVITERKERKNRKEEHHETKGSENMTTKKELVRLRSTDGQDEQIKDDNNL